MKFDISRAWKDETYRESLSDEQLNALPSNPAGELSDAELSEVSGGCVGSVSFCSTRTVVHAESASVICEINIFSISALISNIAILGAVTQVCVKG